MHGIRGKVAALAGLKDGLSVFELQSEFSCSNQQRYCEVMCVQWTVDARGVVLDLKISESVRNRLCAKF